MGIENRDYMRRSRSEDRGNGFDSQTDEKVEALLRGFLHKHPRFLLWTAVIFIGLLLLALVVALATSGSG